MLNRFRRQIGPSRRQFVSTVVRAPNHARLHPGEHPSPHGCVKWAHPSPLCCFPLHFPNLESWISVDSCQSEQNRTALCSFEPNLSGRTTKELRQLKIPRLPFHKIRSIQCHRRAQLATACTRVRRLVDRRSGCRGGSPAQQRCLPAA